MEEAAAKTRVCYVFANNCHLGKSAANALRLRERFKLAKPTSPPGVAEELFETPMSEIIGAIKRRIIEAESAEAAK